MNRSERRRQKREAGKALGRDEAWDELGHREKILAQRARELRPGVDPTSKTLQLYLQWIDIDEMRGCDVKEHREKIQRRLAEVKEQEAAARVAAELKKRG